LNPSVIWTLAALVSDGLVIWMEVAAITGVDVEFPMMMNVPTAFIDAAPASCTATGTFDVSIITQGKSVPMAESDNVIDELAGTTFSITPTDAYTLTGNASGILVENPPEADVALCATVAVPAIVIVDAIVTYLNGLGWGFIGIEASMGLWTALYLPYSASYTSFTVLSSPACFTYSDIGMCGMCNSYLNGLACGVAGIEGLISFGTTSL